MLDYRGNHTEETILDATARSKIGMTDKEQATKNFQLLKKDAGTRAYSKVHNSISYSGKETSKEKELNKLICFDHSSYQMLGCAKVTVTKRGCCC